MLQAATAARRPCGAPAQAAGVSPAAASDKTRERAPSNGTRYRGGDEASIICECDLTVLICEGPESVKLGGAGKAMLEYGQESDDSPSETFELTGRVKWFNTVKGFGFVATEDENGDVFLHLSALREAGYEGVEQGATVVCEVVRRPKGLQAVRVVNLDSSTAVPEPPRPARDDFAGASQHDVPVVAEGDFLAGTVKWFNPNKGYGFITQGEGTRDIFVHMETLRRVGISHLRRGQAVRVRVGQGPKGPQVAEIEAEDEAQRDS